MKILRFVLDEKGARRGFIDASSEKAIYRKIALFEKDGRRWLQFASNNTGRKNEKGYDIYEPYWQLIDNAQMKIFYDAVLTALDTWLAAGNQPEGATVRHETAGYALGAEKGTLPF